MAEEIEALKQENQLLKSEIEDLKKENLRLKTNFIDKNTVQSEIHSHDWVLAGFQSRLDILQLDNAALRTENSNLRAENDLLRAEIKGLRTQNEALNKSLMTMSERVEKLENDNQSLLSTQKVMEARLKSYDLAKMFVFYHVEPKLNGSLWRDIAPQIADKQAELDDDEITEEEFAKWEQELISTHQLPPISLSGLWRMIRKRHEVAHDDLRAAKKQQVFLDNLQKYQWPDAMSAERPLIDFMIRSLASTKLKKMRKTRTPKKQKKKRVLVLMVTMLLMMK